MKSSQHAISMLIAKYRAIMQKAWRENLGADDKALKRGVCAAALLVSLAASPGLAAAGEIFTYNGTDVPGTNNRLQLTDPYGYNLTNLISPAAKTGNNVTVDYPGNNVNYFFGGYANSGTVSNNTATLMNGIVGCDVYGGVSLSGDATGNTIIMSGGAVGGGVYGGYSNSNATGNTVTISGGTVVYYVYGGYSQNGSATGNTVTISGNPNLTVAILVGGYTGTGSGDVFTGNTLNVKNSGMSAQGVANFQYYNFYLPTTLANGGTMLTVVNAANISNAIIGVGVNGATSALHAGDRITLLSTGGGLTAAGINSRAQALSGIAKIYDFDLTTDANNLYATAVGISGSNGTIVPSTNPQVKALSEGQVSTAAFLSQSADLAAGQGMDNARAAAAGSGVQPSGFAAMGGSSSTVVTGSHVDVRGFSLITGAARETTTDNGNIMNGLFLEAGWGNYSTYNDFANAPSVRGDGDTHYLGAGWLGRWQKNSGQYIESSIRAGRITNKFNSNDFAVAGGSSSNGSYDVSAPYYGIHIGFGQEKDLSNDLKMDTYTKLLWTHQNGSNATVQGDAFDFAATNSYRWQLGAKWLRKTNEHTTLRTGLAYQYEFGGKANATVNGSAVDAPSLKGGTGIVELGVTIAPKSNGSPSLDISLQGFAGKCKGIAGNVQSTWKF